MKQKLLFDLPRSVLVYVGCALTHAPADFKSQVEAFKRELKEFSTVLEFLGLTAGTSRDVWIHDIERCVMRCDLFVAICDYPSIGLGVEFGVQAMYRKQPIVAAAHVDTRVTRLILDPKLEGSFEFVTYNQLSDIIPLIREKAEAIQVEILRQEQVLSSQEFETPLLPGMDHFRIVPATISLAA